jgi:GxxExxY protein
MVMRLDANDLRVKHARRTTRGQARPFDRCGFFAVYNYYGYGLSEQVYAGALEHELRDRGHEIVRELAIAIDRQGRYVARQRLDMVVDGRVVVETKATEKLSPAAPMQLVSYLRATAFEVGLLLHCGPSPYLKTLYRLSEKDTVMTRDPADDSPACG